MGFVKRKVFIYSDLVVKWGGFRWVGGKEFLAA